jgi:hypothetical protein
LDAEEAEKQPAGSQNTCVLAVDETFLALYQVDAEKQV